MTPVHFMRTNAHIKIFSQDYDIFIGLQNSKTLFKSVFERAERKYVWDPAVKKQLNDAGEHNV